jgi:hypothetical protein
MGEEGEGRGDGPRVMSLDANQSRMMTSLRTVSPSRAICLFSSRMSRVPIRLTLYDRESAFHSWITVQECGNKEVQWDCLRSKPLVIICLGV